MPRVRASGMFGRELLMALGGVLLSFSMISGTAAAQNGYAATNWSTVNADARNSNYSPFVAPTQNVMRWGALSDASVSAGPVIDQDGYLWVTTGKSVGTSCLHRLDRDGNTVWSSAPYNLSADLDSMAVMGAPRVDDQGDIYVTDSNQLWAFRPSHTNPASVSVKWVIRLPESSWVSGVQYAIFFVDGYVGVFGLPGTVAIYDRNSGAPAMDELTLPGELSTLDDAESEHNIDVAVESFNASGLLDPEVVSQLLGLETGTEWVLTNSPAVHPDNGRIYITGAGELTADGHGTSRLYVLEIGNSSRQLNVVCEASLGIGGHASSPALSPNGDQVVVVGDDSTVYAFDSNTCVLRWQVDQEEARGTAAPAIGPDGTVYYNGVQEAVAFNPTDGSVRWRINFNDLAESMLDPMFAFRDLPVGTWDPMFTNDRFSIITHVFSVSANRVWIAPVLGYGVDQNPLDREDDLVPTPEISLLIPIDPADGSIAGTMLELPEVADGHIVLDKDGSIFITHMGALSAIFHYGLDELVPTLLKVDEPIGGITALEPWLYKELADEGIVWSEGLNSTASQAAREGTSSGVAAAVADLRQSARQIDEAGTAIVDPHADEELCPDQITTIQNALYGSGGQTGAMGDVSTAANLLEQGQSASQVDQYIQAANTKLETALGAMPQRPQTTVTMAENGAKVTFIGNEVRVKYGENIEHYLGIPYAEPPVGDLRWKRPLPKVWNNGEVVDAGEYGEPCIQCQGTGDNVTSRGSEDCLTLNIFRPKPDYCSGAPDYKRPVMVFIHGGGYITGDAMRYNGFRLANAGDVVVVTVQYRLGVIGFLSLPELAGEDPDGSTGNYGHFDLLLGLKWVQDHIAEFGGDPNNVTLFGQSAGGAITCSLTASPQSYRLYGKDLFKRSIIQSGFCAAALELGSENSTDVDTAIYRSKAVISRVPDCPDCSDPNERLEALRAKSGEDIVLALHKTTEDNDETFYTFPAIDGFYIDTIPGYGLWHGAARGRSIIMGTVQDEGSLLATPYVLPVKTWAEFKKQVTKVVGAVDARSVVALYQKQFSDAQLAYQALWEDFIFTCPSKVNAEHLRSAGSKVYTYNFYADPHSENFSFGAFHGIDVYYIWDYHEVLDSEVGTLGTGDYDLIDIMQQAWTSFAYSGVPLLQPSWPNYNDLMATFDVVGTNRETAQVELVSAKSLSFRGGRCIKLEPVFAHMDQNQDALPDVEIFRTLHP